MSSVQKMVAFKQQKYQSKKLCYQTSFSSAAKHTQLPLTFTLAGELMSKDFTQFQANAMPFDSVLYSVLVFS